MRYRSLELSCLQVVSLAWRSGARVGLALAIASCSSAPARTLEPAKSNAQSWFERGAQLDVDTTKLDCGEALARLARSADRRAAAVARSIVDWQPDRGRPLYVLGDIQGLYPMLLLPLVLDGRVALNDASDEALDADDLLAELESQTPVGMRLDDTAMPRIAWKLRWLKATRGVQVGDLITGRGFGSLRSLAALNALQETALGTRSQIEALLGNHDYGVLTQPHLKHYHPLRTTFKEELAEHSLCTTLTRPGAALYRYLHNRPLMLRFGETVFAHTGQTFGQRPAKLKHSFQAAMARLPRAAHALQSVRQHAGEELREGLIYRRKFWYPAPRHVSLKDYYGRLDARTLIVGHAKSMFDEASTYGIHRAIFAQTGDGTQPELSVIKTESGLDRFHKTDNDDRYRWSRDWALRCLAPEDDGSCPRWETLRLEHPPANTVPSARDFAWVPLETLEAQLVWNSDTLQSAPSPGQ